MPKPEVGTPKWISTQWKKKGLNKLRWYCGLCKVSCRDANGFQLHLAHENHLRREAEEAAKSSVRDTEQRYYADEYSEAFERSFLRYLVRKKLGQRVRAHEAYKALNPDDRGHDVMKATCWGTLGRFIVDLRDRGELEAWRDDDGWIVTVLDGCRAAEWAHLPEAEARKLHTRIDPNDKGPVGWADRDRITSRTVKKTDDDAFQRAGKVQFDEFQASAMIDHAPIVLQPTKKAKGITTWLRPNLVVKARAGPALADFDRVKCVVKAVLSDRAARVQRLDDARQADLDVDKLETVLPAIGKPVRILKGPHAGKLATLDAIDVDAFCASVTLDDGSHVKGLAYDAICKELSVA